MALLSISSGCTTAPREQAPALWPASWDGRRAFTTEHAILYARTGRAVEEIERLSATVAREFARRTGGQPARGLIIINDVEDSQVNQLALDAIEPSTLIPSEIRGLAIERREMVLASPIELTHEQLVGELGFNDESAATVAWAVALPSQRRLEQTAHRMLDATLANPDLGPLERALITGFKPMFATCVADTVGGTRETILYKQFCDTQPGWDEARRLRELGAYSPPPAANPLSTAKPGPRDKRGY